MRLVNLYILFSSLPLPCLTTTTTQIQRATEGKDWFWYVDKTVTLELLETLTAEFLAILDKCPNRLKKIMNSLQHTEDRGRSNQPGSSSTAAPLRTAIPGSGQSSTVSSHVHESHNSHSKAGMRVCVSVRESRII